ncbi:BtrH N-terminal domain-containing protein [Brevibacillus laterosporus]|nr:BtrH N-terminal domain-containing protein [Brevibacillus laterosporus]
MSQNNNILLDIDPLKNFEQNCIEDLVASITYWLGRNYELMFADSWDFGFDQSKYEGQTLGSRLVLRPDNYMPLLEKYHGLESKTLEASDRKETFELVRSELFCKRPVVVTMDSYWVPWDEKYQKENNPHILIIVGIDLVTQHFYCTDPFFQKKGVVLPYNNFEQGCLNAITFFTVSEEKLHFDEIIEDIVEGLSHYMREGRAFVEMKKFAEAIVSSLDMQAEMFGYNEFSNVPLFLQLAEVANGRVKYAHMLSFLGERFLPSLVFYAEELKKLGNGWNVVRGMLIKLYITNNNNPEVLEKIRAKIYNLSTEEERYTYRLLAEIRRLKSDKH